MKNCFFSSAKACIYGDEKYPNLFGTVTFYQFSDYVLVKANIHGLSSSNNGFFGFHIHEGNSCGGTDFSDTGSHFNPSGSSHAYHAGDMPPLLYCNAGAYLSFVTDRFCVKDIIGKTVVIHSESDDFTTQPAGNAGKKIACGVIKNNSHL